MPIYEYKCSACTRKFELLRKRADADVRADCPKCGHGRKTRRVMSTFVGRSSSAGGGSSSVSGSGGCGGCHKSSCAGCRH